MKQQKRKGFTLVELLVVIAILAVLATVSIIGYTSFIKKAKVSNDMALVKQINDMLIADEAVNGKPGTLGGALAIVSEGFNVVNLTPTSDGNDFVYDVENNRFALVDKNGKEVYVASDRKLSANLADRWVIRENFADGLEGYSVYLTKSVTEPWTLDQLVGVEVAKGCEISSLKIDSDAAGTIVVAGKIGTLTINAPKATIRHYDEAGNVEIISVDPTHSYHENGAVTDSFKIANGHLVLADKAVVKDVTITGNNVSVETSVDVVFNLDDAVTDTANIIIKITNTDAKVVVDSKLADKVPEGAETMLRVSKYSELAAALRAGEPYIKLDADIHSLIDAIIVTKDLVLDLNNHKLSGDHAQGVLYFTGNPKVTIKNGTIESTVETVNDKTPHTTIGVFDADVRIENCTIKNNCNKKFVIATNGVQSINSKLVIVNSNISAPTVSGKKGYAAYIPAGDVSFLNCNVTGHVLISGGNVTLDGGVYTATGFNNQSKIWHEADTQSYAASVKSGSAYNMGDSILILNKRASNAYKITGLIIRNITFNTEITLKDGTKAVAYAIKFIDMNNDPNARPVNFVLENNTYNNKINDEDPIMFTSIKGN